MFLPAIFRTRIFRFVIHGSAPKVLTRSRHSVPWIVTPDEFPHPIHVNVECRVNGKIRQKANTRDLVFDIPTTIEFITKYITLEPGDVVSTGTPEGIGPIKTETQSCARSNASVN